MSDKFRFLTKTSLKNKICTKAFRRINILICIIIIAVANLDSIIKFFGGDFDDLVNVYVIDEVGIYDEFESTVDNSMFNLLENYNAKVQKPTKDLETLKKDIIKDETKDIIINVKKVDDPTYERMFDVEIMSYEFIDTILYQSIVSALNYTKRNMALELANIDSQTLNDIDKSIVVDRILLNEDLNENDELMKLVGAVLTIVFILPFFFLILVIIQMIGAEINEEKASRGMEIIISSVNPKTHFLSKLVSSNLFAIIQGVLIIIYGLIGCGIRILTTGTINMSGIINTIASSEDASVSTQSISQMITNSNLIHTLTTGIPYFLVIILLSFFAYTLFIGILASVTTSMEDYNQIQTPVMMFLMAGYFLAIYAAAFDGSTFLKVMSCVPFISGILAPVMYALGEITTTTMLIAILLLIGVCYLLYKYGLKVYKVGILNYSSSNLWKKIFNALKN